MIPIRGSVLVRLRGGAGAAPSGMGPETTLAFDDRENEDMHSDPTCSAAGFSAVSGAGADRLIQTAIR